LTQRQDALAGRHGSIKRIILAAATWLGFCAVPGSLAVTRELPSEYA
jgi:hypothetical protein